MKTLAACTLALLLASTRVVQILGDTTYRVALDLVDGSHLRGNTTIDALGVTRAYDSKKVTVPFSEMVKLYTKGNKNNQGQKTMVIFTKEDDKIKKVRGVIDLPSIKLETIFGDLDVDIVHLRKLRVLRAYIEENEPSYDDGEGSIIFGGVSWRPWRTAFEIQGDRLVSLPKPRPGFDYGHSGYGRGATLVTNVRNKQWRDYSVRFKLGMPGIDPSFNPYGLPQGHNAKFIAIRFHVADAKESWNERGLSAYTLHLSDKRRTGGNYKWRLTKDYNVYSNRPKGFGNIYRDGHEVLAETYEGNDDLDGENGSLVRIDVVGNRIKAWIGGKKIVDVSDGKMGVAIGGQTLDHGGIMIYTPWEDMTWISDFSIKPL